MVQSHGDLDIERSLWPAVITVSCNKTLCIWMNSGAVTVSLHQYCTAVLPFKCIGKVWLHLVWKTCIFVCFCYSFSQKSLVILFRKEYSFKWCLKELCIFISCLTISGQTLGKLPIKVSMVLCSQTLLDHWYCYLSEVVTIDIESVIDCCRINITSVGPIDFVIK